MLKIIQNRIKVFLSKKTVWAAVPLAIFTVYLTPFTAAGVQIWTSDVISEELSPRLVKDAKPVIKELKPVVLVGTRNGSFSGKLVAESGSTIKGLKASAGALSGKSGIIPASNVQVRYGKAWDLKGWTLPGGPDILLDSPSEVSPGAKNPAFLPIWVTVRVPKDAGAGKYTGEITVQPEGAGQVRVPLILEVVDWTLPDPQDYRTFLDFVQSPDTLALEYNVPLWSEKHWKLIDRSFQLLNPTGGRVLYVPLICRTNLGNEQSMVRWIKKGGNKYEYDYTVLDRYLDSAEKNLGKPKLVIFQVWDICQSMKSLERGLWGGETDTKKNRKELLGKGPRVTVLDPATGETDMLFLPRYEEPESKALWQPVFTEIHKKMEKRGLEKTMMLGLMPDLWPNKEEVTFWKDVSGGLAWAIHGHAGHASDVMIGNKGLYKISDIGYAAFVYNLMYNVNPDKGRLYGWQNPALLTCYERGGALNMASALDIRELIAFDITGGERGGGRMGADIWWALRNKKGERSAPVYSRYPENNWRNLDLHDWFLAPGPEGSVSTVRLEALKEGVQVCEARIFLEDVLLDDTKKARIGTELAKRCQAALDEHHRAMWKTVWNNDEDLNSLGKVGTGRFPLEGLWNALSKAGKKLPDFSPGRAMQAEEASKGKEWFALGWQDRERKLFALSGEVAAVFEGKVSGGAGGSALAGFPDNFEAVARAVSKNTGIAGEKLLGLLKNKGVSKEDVIAVCAAAEITKAEPEELYKKRKKVNTAFEFFYELKLDKAAKATLDALIKKIKTSAEEENKK